MSMMEKIGEMVQARTTSLRHADSELAARGLSDAARLETDPELRRQIEIVRDSPDWRERIEAWDKIREMGPAVRGWQAAVRDLLHQADGWGRIFAAESLAWHRCCEAEAMPVLLAALETTLDLRRYDWSRLACGAIGKYLSLPRPLAEQAVPKLTEALRADDRDVRGYAALALGNWGAQSRPALVELADLHDRAGQIMRDHYLEVMQKIDPRIADSLDALVLALESPDSTVRAKAAAALGKWGKAGDRFLARLLHLTRDDNPEVRRNLALALGQMEAGEPEALTALQRLANDGEPAVRLATAYALGRLGINVEENLQRLRMGLKNGTEPLRMLSAWALGEIGGKTPWRTTTALRRALQKEESETVREAIRLALKHV